jgi:MYXO-CTERM domain-containing protein
VPVTVVVDGWEGAVSDFVLEVSCNGSWGNTTPVDTVDTALPPTTTGPDTGTTGSTGSTGSTDTPVGDDDDDDGLDEVGTLVGPAAVAPRTTGCACQSATGPGAGGLLLLVGALVLRRRG